MSPSPTLPSRVLLVVVDPNHFQALGSIKLSDASGSIGGKTFPSGTALDSESIPQAASRVLKEESGLRLSEESWTLLKTDLSESEAVFKLVAISTEVSKVNLVGRNTLLIYHIPTILAAAHRAPWNFEHDFSPTLRAALIETSKRKPNRCKPCL